MKYTADGVQPFIHRFHCAKDVDTVFTNGCCYWFAKILYERFHMTRGADIMYDEVANHFGTQIDGRVFDITGDVTWEYSWKPWSSIGDELLRARIVRDCIMF